MAKHTPGPWEWEQHGRGSASLDGPDEGVLVHDAAWSVRKADARLIAAAPDGLDLAREIDQYLSGNVQNYIACGSILHQKVRAFIVKATRDE